jgi:hypothetical protein
MQAMFLLSVDSLAPHYLDSQEDDQLHQAVAFGDSILVVQNKQVAIPCTHVTSITPSTSAVSGRSTGSSSSSSVAEVSVARSWNGRNPVRASLQACARVLLGMTLSPISVNRHTYSHSSPQRVSFRFSDIELVGMVMSCYCCCMRLCFIKLFITQFFFMLFLFIVVTAAVAMLFVAIVYA